MSTYVSCYIPLDWSLYFKGSLLSPDTDYTLVSDGDNTTIILNFHVFRGESLILFRPGSPLVISIVDEIKKGTSLHV